MKRYLAFLFIPDTGVEGWEGILTTDRKTFNSPALSFDSIKEAKEAIEETNEIEIGHYGHVVDLETGRIVLFYTALTEDFRRKNPMPWSEEPG